MIVNNSTNYSMSERTSETSLKMGFIEVSNIGEHDFDKRKKLNASEIIKLA